MPFTVDVTVSADACSERLYKISAKYLSAVVLKKTVRHIGRKFRTSGIYLVFGRYVLIKRECAGVIAERVYIFSNKHVLTYPPDFVVIIGK